ncbi:MAG: hypothetical protein NT002_00035 [candidate division Zixibacteria bacterium]|nr:hypothetical protein [candidate division Zixibacteria bacterium]
MKRLWSIWGITILVAIVALVGGCSRDKIIGQVENPADYSSWDPAGLYASPGDSVQFSARVRTTDQNRRMLTFNGISDTVIAAHNCEIVRLNNNNSEAPIPFGDIQPDDSVEIKGVRQQNKYVLAHKIRNCTRMGNFDLSFRDTILTIDYDAMTFTVSNRSETIMADSNTIIRGTLTRRIAYDDHINGETPGSGTAGKLINQYMYSAQDTTLNFADLTIGNVVEIRANILDSVTLLALYIHVANCQDKPQQCTQFTAPLASVDIAAKIVTWEGYNWTGLVCKGTQLLAADGTTELTLADFAVGEMVAVKGLPLVGDTLKVCKMEKAAE